MTSVNSNSPIARREALSDRIEQLRRMMEIRFVEERIQKLFSEGHVRGSTHLASGQEAVAVGIARSIDVDDIVTCTYRGHSPRAGARRHAAGRDRRDLRPHHRLRRRRSADRCIWSNPRSG